MLPRRLLLSTALLGGLLLAGCTAERSAPSEPSAAPTPAPSAAAPTDAPTAAAPSASPTPTTAAEGRYVTAVQQLDPALATVDPAILIALGHDVCTSLGRGDTVQQVAESFGTGSRISGFSGAQAAVIIGAAVPTLCPQYRDRLQTG